MGLNVFEAEEVDYESTLIPDGTLVKVVIATDGVIKTSQAQNELVNLTLTVCDGRYKGSKFYENIGISGSEGFVRLGHSKLKAILETGKGARVREDYDIPNFKALNGLKAVVQVKVETYFKNDGKAAYKNTVAKYGSANPASSRNALYIAYENGEQPNQTGYMPPLPPDKAGTGGGYANAAPPTDDFGYGY